MLGSVSIHTQGDAGMERGFFQRVPSRRRSRRIVLVVKPDSLALLLVSQGRNNLHSGCLAGRDDRGKHAEQQARGNAKDHSCGREDVVN